MTTNIFLSDNPCPYAVFDATSTGFVISALKDIFFAAGWDCINQPAFIIGTLSPSNGQTLQVGTVLYTFVDTLSSVDGQVLIGLTAHATVLNLFDAINANPLTAGTAYYFHTVTNNPTVAAVLVDGNKITLNAIPTGGDGNYIPITGIGTWDWGTRTPGTGFSGTKLLFGGWRFRYRSVQRLIVYVSIYDNGPTSFSAGSVRVQVQSGISDMVGIEHGLDVPSPTGQLQAVVNGGCFFISNPGTAGYAGFGRVGMSVCGGLLHILTSGADDPPTEAWFSFGDNYGNPFFLNMSPRTNLYTNFFGAALSNEGVWSGSRTGDLNADPAEIRIVPKNAANEEMESVIQWQCPIDDTHPARPILYEPLVAWGDSAGFYPIIRGVIPDARISSIPADVDTTITEAGTHWINYTHQYIKGGLWLRYNATSIPSATGTTPSAQYQKQLGLGVPPKP